MKLALISDADTPGPIRHIARDWRVNSIEALAHMMDGHVWHGTVAHDAALHTLSDYDLILINMKHTLWAAVPRLVQALGPQRCVGLQEGPSDMTARIPLHVVTAFAAAHRAIRALFIYDMTAARIYAAHFPHLKLAHTFLPVYLERYEPFRAMRAQWLKAYRGPRRLMAGSTLGDGRGAAHNLAAFARGCTVLGHARDHHEISVASDLVCSAGGTPDIVKFVPWAWTAPRAASNGSFLSRLATCHACTNFDLWPTYGRLAVDCAALGVPCYGLEHTTMQLELWPPEYAADNILLPLRGPLPNESDYDSRHADAARTALDRLTALCSPDVVRKCFVQSLASIL